MVTPFLYYLIFISAIRVLAGNVGKDREKQSIGIEIVKNENVLNEISHGDNQQHQALLRVYKFGFQRPYNRIKQRGKH